MVNYLNFLSTPSPQPEPPDYAGIYQRLLLECSRAADSMSDKALRKRLSYLGVKGGPIIYNVVLLLSGKNISLDPSTQSG